MKFGALGFSYHHFDAFGERLKQSGYYTVNLGDNTQTIAIRHVYRELGIPDDAVVVVDRDTLSTYAGEEVMLVMNGAFGEFSFPLSPKIHPIFVGFHAGVTVIQKNADFFRAHQPIGCRDSATTAFMLANGIEAFTSGCVTLTLPKRQQTPAAPKLLVVYGEGPGQLPPQVLKHIPADLADTAEFVFHRLAVDQYPLSRAQSLHAETYERGLLDKFRDQATLVLTPLHHVATPCIAMGIPVIVCRVDVDNRFSFLKELLPITTPDQCDQIDWRPEPVDVDKVRAEFIRLVGERIAVITTAGQPQSKQSEPMRPEAMQNIPQLQTNRSTFFGRHWAEYQMLRRYKTSDHGLSILSFGCSSGEEVATLKTAFPGAALFGCDQDWNNLREARALLGNTATIFDSSEAEIRRHGPYDIIVCNSVLLTHTRIENGIFKGIDASLWSDVVSIIDDNLKPGGIVQIINSHIPFRFHGASAAYTPLRTKLLHGPNFVDVFDPSGNHLAAGIGGTGWSAVIPRHLSTGHSDLLDIHDLEDIHFWKGDGGSRPAAVDDAIIPTLPITGAWASGSMTYRPDLSTHSDRRSTYVEIDLSWSALATDSVRVSKKARRIWFDGSVVLEGETTIDHVGASATAFIETTIGRSPTFISMTEATRRTATRSTQFGV